MAEGSDSTDLNWFDPPIRAIIPLDDHFHIPKRLKRTIRQHPYDIKFDTTFNQVICACATPMKGRPTTWINHEIKSLYNALHWRDHAHSIEAWDGDELVGGLYGVSLGGAFFGESMFSRKTDAGKIALVYLVALLRYCGFTLLDTQFQTEHLAQFGTYEIPRANYLLLLEATMKKNVRLTLPPHCDWRHLVEELLHPVIHIS